MYNFQEFVEASNWCLKRVCHYVTRRLLLARFWILGELPEFKSWFSNGSSGEFAQFMKPLGSTTPHPQNTKLLVLSSPIFPVIIYKRRFCRIQGQLIKMFIWKFTGDSPGLATHVMHVLKSWQKLWMLFSSNFFFKEKEATPNLWLPESLEGTSSEGGVESNRWWDESFGRLPTTTTRPISTFVKWILFGNAQSENQITCNALMRKRWLHLTPAPC